MENIFETAKVIGCLGPYLDELRGKQHLKEWQGSALWKAALARNT